MQVPGRMSWNWRTSSVVHQRPHGCAVARPRRCCTASSTSASSRSCSAISHRRLLRFDLVLVRQRSAVQLQIQLARVYARAFSIVSSSSCMKLPTRLMAQRGAPSRSVRPARGFDASRTPGRRRRRPCRRRTGAGWRARFSLDRRRLPSVISCSASGVGPMCVRLKCVSTLRAVKPLPVEGRIREACVVSFQAIFVVRKYFTPQPFMICGMA